MAATLLTILKIIGIVLLCIIGLLLLIILTVLFVPVRYRIRCAKPRVGDPDAHGAVTFLLHMISIRVDYEGEVAYGIRLFGIKIWPRKSRRPSKPDKPETPEPSDVHDNVEETADVTQEAECEYSIDWNEDPAAEEVEDDVSSGEQQKEQEEQEEPEQDIADRIEALIDKISAKCQSAAGKYDSLKKKIRFWDKMINDTHNRDAVDFIKKRIAILLKKIAPRRVKGLIHFGFEDPATTGRILMYLSIIYPVLPHKLRIDPGFEDTDIFGDLDIKGHICVITPVMCFIRIYFNKDCRRMWRLYKKHSEN